MQFKYISKDKIELNGKQYGKDDFITLIESDMLYGIVGKNTSISSDEIKEKKQVEYIVERTSGFNIQRILFGPPGTGKSYEVNELIKKYYGDYNAGQGNNDNVFRTAIHADYDYYDFVGNIMPKFENSNNEVAEHNEIIYNFNPGVFTLSLEKALITGAEVFLVLEEMSRGNIASIFGDLFQLLDRDENGNSSYSIKNNFIADYLLGNSHLTRNISLQNKNIYLPHNLHILGTINTSDQNVFVIDTAFRRRFEMEYISVKPIRSVNGDYLNDSEVILGNLSTTWIKLYEKLNVFITKKMRLSEDKQLGQFFLKFKEIKESDSPEIKAFALKYNAKQVNNKLLLYLWENVEKSNYQSEHKLFENHILTLEELIDENELGNNIFNKGFMSIYE